MPRRPSFRLLACLIALPALSLALGCGSGKPADQARAQVTGTVTLDKQPLKTGKILFDPGNGTPPATLDILDGKYEGRVPVGKNTVRINSVVKMAMKDKMKKDGPGYEGASYEENLLPPRYNQSSDISREVVADGTNTFNFDLEKK